MSDLSSLFKIAANAHKKEDVLSTPQEKSPLLYKNKVVWSSQQEAFLNSKSPKMVLTALAGTGKSSMLMEYARRTPHKKWNFIAFNKSVVDNLRGLAPSNVRLRTAHSMAFEKFGCDLHHKLDKPVNADCIIDLLSLNTLLSNKHYIKSLIDGLRLFVWSSKRVIDFSFCDKSLWKSLQDKYPDASWDEGVWISNVQELWRRSLDPNSNLGIDHDIYLKRFTMQEPIWMGDYWMLDEAQDWSEAFLDAFSRCTKNSIRAGDPYQNLYEWRGASVESWIKDPKEKEFWLTQSYRTGTGVENLVNLRLSNLSCQQTWNGNPDFNCKSVDLLENPINIKSFSPDIIIGSTWEELSRLAILCQSHGIEIQWPQDSPNYDGVKSSQSILFTTVFRAKGLQFNKVWISDGVLPEYESHQQKNKIAYVAITRAINHVRVPSIWIEDMPAKQTIQRAFD